MTVAEYIAELQKLPGDLPVLVWSGDGDFTEAEDPVLWKMYRVSSNIYQTHRPLNDSDSGIIDAVVL